MNDNEPTEQIPDVSKVVITATMDMLTTVGMGHGTCELVPGKDKTACRHLLEPLDAGKGDPIDQLSDLQMAHPEEFEELTDYLNSVIMRVSERSQQKTEAMNATG